MPSSGPPSINGCAPAQLAILFLAAATLLPDPENPRQFSDREDFQLELRLLGDDMKRRGVLLPLLVRRNGDVYVVIDGHRRLAAALLVGGIDKLPCIVVPEGTSEAQVRQIQLVTSLTKADLSAYERYAGFSSLKALTPGMTNKQLAAEVGVTEGLVSMVLSLDKCVPQAKELAQKGLLNLSDWYRLSKLSPEKQLAKLNGHQESTDAENAKVTRLNCDVPGRKAKLSIVGKDISLSQAVEIVQDWLREAKKAVDQGLSAQSFQRVCKDKARG